MRKVGIGVPDDIPDDMLDALNEHCGRICKKIKQALLDEVTDSVPDEFRVLLMNAVALEMAGAAFYATTKRAKREGKDDPIAQVCASMAMEAIMPQMMQLLTATETEGVHVIRVGEDGEMEDSTHETRH